MTDAALAADLREAIERGGDLLLHYLPEISFATGRVVGMDALARWSHPERGPIPPARFVALAEEIGLLGTLTEWVLKTAFRQCRVWRDDGYELVVSVNLSPANIEDERLPRLVTAQARALGVKPEWIRLEIPERAITAAGDRIVPVAAALRAVHMCLVVDEVGSVAATSRAAIGRIGAGAIKLGRSAVSRVGEPAVADAMRATIAAAKGSGLLVLAQGIEDRATYDALRALGCDGGLGYFISRPRPPLDLATWLVSSPWGLGR